VRPATSKSYGDARDIVNGDHRRWLVVLREFTGTPSALVRAGAATGSWMRSTPSSEGCAASWACLLVVRRLMMSAECVDMSLGISGQLTG